MRGPDQPRKPTSDPDLRSRPIQTSRSRPMIQTFVLFWLDIFFYKVLKSTTPYYKVLLQYYSVLQRTTPVLLCTTKYYSVLEKFGHPVPDLVPDRSRPVPDQFHFIQGQCPFTAMLPKKQKQVCASSAELFDSF